MQILNIELWRYDWRTIFLFRSLFLQIMYNFAILLDSFKFELFFYYSYSNFARKRMEKGEEKGFLSSRILGMKLVHKMYGINECNAIRVYVSRSLYRGIHGWAEHVARTLHTRWALEVEAVMLFAYGHGGAASPLVQKHLAASPYLALFRSHYLSSPFDASRRLSPPHSRLVVWLAKGLTYFRTVRTHSIVSIHCRPVLRIINIRP